MSLKDHPALVAGVISAVLVAARLLAVARFDVNTAATILSVSGTATAVAGTLLTLLPFGLVLATCFLALVVFIDPTLVHLSSMWTGMLLALAVGATLSLVAVPLAVVTVAVVLVVALLGRLARRQHPRPRVADVIASSRVLKVQTALLFVLLVLMPILLQRPWLPVQAVTLDSGRVLVGYVLGDAHGQVAVMADEDRTITFVETADIESRIVCSGTGVAGGSVGERLPRVQLRGSLIGSLLWGDQIPRYPTCPESSD